MEVSKNVLNLLPNAQRSVDVFKDHKLTIIEMYHPETKRGEYRWGKPNSRNYEIYLIFRPNTIIMYGDIGTYVFKQDGINLAWLRGSINSPSYLLSKLTNEHNQKYDSKQTKQHVAERIEEYCETYEEQTKLISEFEEINWDLEDEVIEFLQEFLQLDDPYDNLVYNWNAAGGEWLWAALTTFIQELDK